VLATGAVLAAAAWAVGLPPRGAVAVGFLLSLSSTAIVLQSLTESGLMRTDAGERSFAVLLFQDIAVIPMLVALPLLAGPGVEPVTSHHAGGPREFVEGLSPLARALATLGAVAAIVGAGRFLVRPVLRFIARSRVREVFTAAALGIVVGIALLMEWVGLSPALGSFLGGVVLAGSEYRHELESDIEPFKGLLLGLFFIAVGSSVDFGLVAEQAGSVALLVAGLVALKFLVLLALARGFGMSLDQGLLFGLALAQGGEFAFVLLSLATEQRVLESQAANLLVATVALSMALTPLLLLLNERVLQPRFGTRERPSRDPDRIDERNPVILAGFGAFGSVLGRFLVANGVPTTVLDIDSDHVDLMRRLGMKAFYGDASREELLRAAGAARARILIVSTGSLESTLDVIHTARTHFPHLEIFARARARIEAYEVREAGADHVYRTSLDTSLRAGSDVLRRLGFRAYRAHRAAQRFRRLDERQWLELAEVRQDDTVFETRARESIRVLEQLLRDEFQEARRIEHGWDVEPDDPDPGRH
jgi:Kef-type K+ transport system membrane component KefB/voltage-gated potassium channel Kch